MANVAIHSSDLAIGLGMGCYSLCSVLSKLVMKIIANRFRYVFPNIISQELASFITGRNIMDNILIAQEVIHSMRGKNNKKSCIVVKIDLEKAYDRLRLDFIDASLKVAYILTFLSEVIMDAISGSTLQVLWNGVPTQEFRRTRQGYPLFPYLFVLHMKCLGHSFHSKISNGYLRAIRLPIVVMDLLHLFFDDDLVIFSRVDLRFA